MGNVMISIDYGFIAFSDQFHCLLRVSDCDIMHSIHFKPVFLPPSIKLTIYIFW